METKKDSVKTTQTTSISGRLSPEEDAELKELLSSENLNSNVCAFVTDAVKAAIEMIRDPAPTPSMPKWLAQSRACYEIASRYREGNSVKLK